MDSLEIMVEDGLFKAFQQTGAKAKHLQNLIFPCLGWRGACARPGKAAADGGEAWAGDKGAFQFSSLCAC